MVEIVVYLNEELLMIHRDLHLSQWIVTEDNEIFLLDFD
jgi:predicted trehalose synthase